MRRLAAILDEGADDQRKDDGSFDCGQRQLCIAGVLDSLGHDQGDQRQPDGGGKSHPAGILDQLRRNQEKGGRGRRNGRRNHEKN